MAQYSSSLARRTGSAHLPSEPSGFFETMKTVPARLFTQRARTPVMFGSLGSNCVGWYGNEPEAKVSGGSNMHTNLFGFGSVHEDIEYLGDTAKVKQEIYDTAVPLLLLGGMFYLLKKKK